MPTAKHHAIAIHTFQRNHPTKQDGEEDGKSSNSVCVRDCKRSYPCNWSYHTNKRNGPARRFSVMNAGKAYSACPHAFDDFIVVAEGALDKLFFLFHKTSRSNVNVCRRCLINCGFRCYSRLAYGGVWTLKIWTIIILQHYRSLVNLNQHTQGLPGQLSVNLCFAELHPKFRLPDYVVRLTILWWKIASPKELRLRATQHFYYATPCCAPSVGTYGLLSSTDPISTPYRRFGWAFS